MANLKSSKKAIKVIAKKTNHNHEIRMRVTNIIKSLEKCIATNDVEKANSLLKDLQKYIDKATSKGLVSKNTADRQKSRLNKKVKNMEE